MTDTPRVSLCVLTYKRASILPRSLDGLLAQTYQDFEIIINDDCSPDNTATVGRAYEAKDPRVRYCRNERNLRYAGNQNAAVERARGEFVAFIHDGDIYRPDMLEKWVTAIDRNPRAAFVFNSQGALDDQGKLVRVHEHPLASDIPGRVLFDFCIRQPSIPVWGILMVRKSCLQAVGPFETDFPVIADVDMWLRLMLQFDCVYVREPLVWLAPREKGHQNAGVNWRISTEFERIYWRNLKRRMELDPEGTRWLVPEVKVMLRMRWMAQFLSTLLHARPLLALGGLKHFWGFQQRRRQEFGE